METKPLRSDAKDQVYFQTRLFLSFLLALSVGLNASLYLKDHLRSQSLNELQYLNEFEMVSRFGEVIEPLPPNFLQQIDRQVLSGTGQAGFATGFYYCVIAVAGVLAFMLCYSLLGLRATTPSNGNEK